MCSKNDQNEKLINAQKIDKNATIIELTKEEQDLYIKSILAHELRHFIQDHLIASTENSNAEQRKNIDKSRMGKT